MGGIDQLDKPKRILFVSGVLKGYEVIQAAAEYRAQEFIRPTTQRILIETGCKVK